MWLSRLRETLRGGTLDEAERLSLARETADTNRRRLAVLLPLIVIAHAFHVAVFHVSDAERATLDPRTLEWRLGIAWTHVVTGVCALAFAAVAVSSKKKSPRWLGSAVAGLYLLHAAVIASIDQLTITSVTPFVGYALGIAVVILLEPLKAVALYAGALAVFVFGVTTMQSSANARLAEVPNGVSIVVISVALSWLSRNVRRRDFVQRATIDRQRAQLADLNATLEERIEAQVSEAKKLNAQLQAQVLARSSELSDALAKLEMHQADEGSLVRGALLGDRFEVNERIGHGGMGEVYAGVDRSTGERVAIKVIAADAKRDVEVMQRFVREAASAASIAHPAVVRMIHVDVSSEGVLFQVQELVRGEPLRARMHGGRRWDVGNSARLVSVLCDALAAAHERGVVHRDVKPSNVMITRDPPGLKLLDFGIAKLFEGALTSDRATLTGAMLGTPAFMAPEQVDGKSGIGDRADVYAVGVMLFLMLTGKYPFGEMTPQRMMMSHVLEQAPDVRVIEKSVPREVSALVARCLAKAPNERPSAAELARALTTIADEHGARLLHEIETADALREIPALSIPPPSQTTVVEVKLG